MPGNQYLKHPQRSDLRLTVLTDFLLRLLLHPWLRWWLQLFCRNFMCDNAKVFCNFLYRNIVIKLSVILPLSAQRIGWHCKKAQGFVSVGLPGLLCLSLFPLVVQAAGLLVEPERTQMYAGESLTLNIVADGLEGNISLDPLAQDFELLGSSSSSQVTSINGQFSTRKSWRVELMPLRTGELTIPALRVNGISSAPVTITVLEAAADSSLDPQNANRGNDVFLEAELDRDTAWVQGQVVYIVRFFSAVNILNGSLTEPMHEQLDVERLGDDAGYITERNGRRYRVVERRFALFPQQSGEIEIPPLRLQVSVPADNTRGSGFFGQTRTLTRTGPALAFTVNARPAQQQGAWWLPATRVELSGSFENRPLEFRVGEPITRKLVLRAEGVRETQLPLFEPPQIPGLKIYPDKPVSNTRAGADGMRAERTESWALIPQQSGTFTLPAMTVNWFNTQTGQAETAELPAETLTVLPALPPTGEQLPLDTTANSNDSVVQPDATSTPDSAISDNTGNSGTEAQGRDQSGADNAGSGAAADGTGDAHVSGLNPLRQPAASGWGAAPWWPVVAAAGLLGWFATALGWWASRRGSVTARGREDATRGVEAQNRRAALAAVARASKSGDTASAADAVRAWAAKFAGLPGSLHGLATAARKAGNNDLADNLVALERQRYAAASTAQSAVNLDSLPVQLRDFGKGLLRASRSSDSFDSPSAHGAAGGAGLQTSRLGRGSVAGLSTATPAVGPDHAKGELPEL